MATVSGVNVLAVQFFAPAIKVRLMANTVLYSPAKEQPQRPQIVLYKYIHIADLLHSP